MYTWLVSSKIAFCTIRRTNSSESLIRVLIHSFEVGSEPPQSKGGIFFPLIVSHFESIIVSFPTPHFRVFSAPIRDSLIRIWLPRLRNIKKYPPRGRIRRDGGIFSLIRYVNMDVRRYQCIANNIRQDCWVLDAVSHPRVYRAQCNVCLRNCDFVYRWNSSLRMYVTSRWHVSLILQIAM